MTDAVLIAALVVAAVATVFVQAASVRAARRVGAVSSRGVTVVRAANVALFLALAVWVAWRLAVT